MIPSVRCLVIGLLAGVALDAAAAALADVAAIPHLPPEGQQDYQRFLAAEGSHRAFAIAPGGAWGWHADAPSSAQASEAALAACRENTAQRCVLYAVDDQVVFDSQAWPHLWGPYASAAQAAAASVGREPGRRFPDLAFTHADGTKSSLAALRGKVVLVHFWGSWCGPCRHELPGLQALRKKLGSPPGLQYVVLQGRESIATSRQWLKREGIDLPLADSGSRGESDGQFHLADGLPIPDRELARVYPSTYVLDRRGIVVFAHQGAVHDWPQYAPFVLDALRAAGK